MRFGAPFFLLLPAVVAITPAPAGAQPAATVLDVQGELDDKTREALTQRWRWDARPRGEYRWMLPKSTTVEMQLLLGCGDLDLRCALRMGRRMKLDVIFLARLDQGAATFERIDVQTGNVAETVTVQIGSGEPAGGRFVRAGALFVAGELADSGTISVAGGGASVWVDGEEVGATPLVRGGLPTGAHRIEVRREGVESHTEEVWIEPGATVRIEPGAALSGPALVERPGPLSRVRWTTWLATGVAVALMGTGIGFGVAAQDAESALNDPSRSCFTAPELRDCKDLEGLSHSRATMANVFYGLSAAAAATAGVLFYMDFRHGESARLEVAVRW